MSEIELRVATMADGKKIADYLKTQMYDGWSIEHWLRIFDNRWVSRDYGHGAVAVAQGRIIGYTGMVYSERIIDGRKRLFGSNTSWYIHKSYRGQKLGYRLAKIAMNQEDAVYVSIGHSTNIIPILTQIGYQPLESEQYVWQTDELPGGAAQAAGGPSGMQFRYFSIEDGGSRADCQPLLSTAPIDLHQLSAEQLKLMDDHRGLKLRGLRFEGASLAAPIFMILKESRKYDQTYFDTVSLEPGTGLPSVAQQVIQFLANNRPAKLAVNCRFLPPPESDAALAEVVKEPLSVPSLYLDRSSRGIRPEQVANTYLELVLLDQKLS